MAMKKLSLQEVLEGIEDTRRERSVWYPLYEVLFIMLTAVICVCNIIRKGGNVREKQGTVVEEVHKIGKWDTGCLYIPERHQSNRHPAATHSVCGVDAECSRKCHRHSSNRRETGAANKGCQEAAAACSQRFFS